MKGSFSSFRLAWLLRAALILSLRRTSSFGLSNDISPVELAEKQIACNSSSDEAWLEEPRKEDELYSKPHPNDLDAEAAVASAAEEDWMSCSDYEKLSFDYVISGQSHYQEIGIYHFPKSNDCCLHLNDYLHTSASSRPHYHETFVHYAARYIDKVQRVIFIGGGDSMVLHEVLKYNETLELVVGLELDHDVNKATFLSFGTQPHWDNDKVEWYYGDAAKVMAMLPKDYYGSFDLVIVDVLTEVAQNLKVNNELSLMDAAMLLMKPVGGIIVKNEDEGYVPGSTTNYTQFSVDLAFRDVPLYCLQVFVVGSNSVDFLTATPKDHGVEMLYIKGVDEFRQQFDSWYNFGTSSGGMGSFCRRMENKPKQHRLSSSPPLMGVLLVLEAENIVVPIDNVATVELLLFKVLETAEMPVGAGEDSVSFSLSENGLEGFTIIVRVVEGFVTARCFPQLRYCAFDIHLDGESIEKLPQVKEQVLGAVKPKDTSSYHFVIPGFHSSKKRMDTINNLGPPAAEDICKAVNDKDNNDASSRRRTIRRAKRAKDFDAPKAASLHSYDHTDALAQWRSQRPLARQGIISFISPSFVDKDAALNLLRDATDFLLQSLSQQDAVENKTVVSNVGEDGGLALVAGWSGGDLVATFNGATQIVYNIFSLSDVEFFDVSEEVLEKYFEEWLIIRNEVVRGTGSPVNFKEEIEEFGHTPVWAH